MSERAPETNGGRAVAGCVDGLLWIATTIVVLVAGLSVATAAPATARTIEPAPSLAASPSPFAVPSLTTTTPAGLGVFTGLGFDACEAPSLSTMKAWLASPYRAVGIYIGGENRTCEEQPNLSTNWVSTEVAAGWYLVPIYVGLQSPTSSCNKCTRIDPGQAFAQGSDDAVDAVKQAAFYGIGTRSPIYFDMEHYDRNPSASAAVLTFLAGWTKKIHSLGYRSGVYVHNHSGVLDLVSKLGTSYPEPDDIWFVNWNGVADGREKAIDEKAPAAWTPHRRIHQYRGDMENKKPRTETYGGVTLRVDDNYVDAATVTLGETEPLGYLDLAGAPTPGQVRVAGWAFDPNAPTQPLAIRVYVGGRAGAPGAVKYELGVVATSPRSDIGALYPEAGPAHGFDATFPVLQYGSQKVCTYAVGIPPGADRPLGCRDVQVPVAIALSQVKATKAGVQARLSCGWPASMTCQGRLKLRTIINGKKHWLGGLGYKLQGKRSQTYTVALNEEGRALLKRYGKLKVDVIATVTGGGRRISELVLRSG